MHFTCAHGLLQGSMGFRMACYTIIIVFLITILYGIILVRLSVTLWTSYILLLRENDGMTFEYHIKMPNRILLSGWKGFNVYARKWKMDTFVKAFRCFYPLAKCMSTSRTLLLQNYKPPLAVVLKHAWLSVLPS